MSDTSPVSQGNGAPQAERSNRSIGRTLLRLIEILIFVITIGIIVLCIGELAARNTLQAQIQQEIIDISDFLARNTAAGNSQGVVDSAQGNSDLEYARSTIRDLRSLLTNVRVVQSVGSNFTDSIQYIASNFSRISSGTYMAPYLDPDGDQTIADQLFEVFFRWPGKLNSEILLAITVCLGGLVGALVAGFRTDAGTLHRDIPLGIASGFVVYLAIKGGKFVFLMQTQETSFAMNPYGCAFAGLLAGLFTEKAYLLLTALIDELSRRLTNVVTSDTKRDEPIQRDLKSPESAGGLSPKPS